MRALLSLTFLALSLATPAGATEKLADGGKVVVVEVVDGDTVRLDDGAQIRLVGIQAPKLPLGRRNFPTWPLADESKRFLEKLTLNREVRMRFGGRRKDRHDRWLAHLVSEQDGWIQEKILRAGMARVYSFRDNRALVPEMLTAEREARAAGRGIWSHPFYAIRSEAETGRHLDTFQLVEARVDKVAVVRGRLYLNFGADWRRDFTVSFRPRDRKRLDKEGFDYRGLAGRRIRVRGWLKSWNGPMIEATHGEQIELLE